MKQISLQSMSKKEIKEAVRTFVKCREILQKKIGCNSCVQIKESQLMQKLTSDFVVEYIHSFNTHVRGICLG